MSNTSRGTILCTWLLTPPSIASINPHIHTGYIFQPQSAFISLSIIANEREFGSFMPRTRNLDFDPKWRSGCQIVLLLSCKNAFQWQDHPRKLVLGLTPHNTRCSLPGWFVSFYWQYILMILLLLAKTTQPPCVSPSRCDSK
jgi:hypothetical protein